MLKSHTNFKLKVKGGYNIMINLGQLLEVASDNDSISICINKRSEITYDSKHEIEKDWMGYEVKKFGTSDLNDHELCIDINIAS